MSIKTKRWTDPIEPDDGLRVLVTRYRPRGVRKEDETWDRWEKRLAPSVELLREMKVYPPLPWDEFVLTYSQQMQEPEPARLMAELAETARTGNVTLLCYCEDKNGCHRTILQALIQHRLDFRRPLPTPPHLAK